MVGDSIWRILPGLLTCILIWVQSYFILAYHPSSEQFVKRTITLALAARAFRRGFVIFYIPLVKESAIDLIVDKQGDRR